MSLDATTIPPHGADPGMPLEDVLAASAAAARALPPWGDPAYAAFCDRMVEELERNWASLIAANALDVERAQQSGMPPSLLDRITLQPGDLAALRWWAGSIVRGLSEPPQRPLPRSPRADVSVERASRPLGVVLMIYEARPAVTIEGALMLAATGNAGILRGGSEIAETTTACGALVRAALTAAGLPADLIQAPALTRAEIRQALSSSEAIDAVIPRGSPSLVNFCLRTAAMPVIASGGGINHLYVHSSADPDRAAAIALDSKSTQPTACNTLEVVLVDEGVAADFVAALVRSAGESGQRILVRTVPELVGEPTETATFDELRPIDFDRESLEHSLCVQPVPGVGAAVEHVREHGSGHTEGVVAREQAAADAFVAGVDAACVVVNGSLRLHDGPTMGLGPELSISTGRLHVRGPVSLSDLRTFSWVVRGTDTLRGTTPAWEGESG